MRGRYSAPPLYSFTEPEYREIIVMTCTDKLRGRNCANPAVRRVLKICRDFREEVCYLIQ